MPDISIDTILLLYSSVVETVFLGVVVYWLKFDKKQAKKRKPRQKQLKVTVPTIVVENGNGNGLHKLSGIDDAPEGATLLSDPSQ